MLRRVIFPMKLELTKLIKRDLPPKRLIVISRALPIQPKTPKIWKRGQTVKRFAGKFFRKSGNC